MSRVRSNQFVGAFNVLCVGNTDDPEINLHEVVNRAKWLPWAFGLNFIFLVFSMALLRVLLWVLALD